MDAKDEPLPALAYASDKGGSLDLYVVPAGAASARRLVASALDELSPSWAPDGRHIAYRVNPRRSVLGDIRVVRADGRGRRFGSHRDGQFEIYATRLDGSRQMNLTRTQASDQWPAWSPDGRSVAFMSDREGSPDVFVMRADGSSPTNLTRTPDLEESHPAWLPDGRISFTRHAETGPIEMWAVDPDGRNGSRLSISAEPVFVYAWKTMRR